MKQLLFGLFCLFGLTATAAFMTWKIVGPPDRSVDCDPASLPEHFVCLSTVRDWPAEEILWVDARPRQEWEYNGISGSVLLNAQEDWNELEPEFMMQMMLELKPKVVVYCNQAGCGSSQYIANELRDRHADLLGFEVFVLHGGMKALRAERP